MPGESRLWLQVKSDGKCNIDQSRHGKWSTKTHSFKLLQPQVLPSNKRRTIEVPATAKHLQWAIIWYISKDCSTGVRRPEQLTRPFSPRLCHRWQGGNLKLRRLGYQCCIDNYGSSQIWCDNLFSIRMRSIEIRSDELLASTLTIHYKPRPWDTYFAALALVGQCML